MKLPDTYIFNMSKHPVIKWAQRKDRLFLTVQVRDAKNEKIDLKAGQLDVHAEADGVTYAFSIELYREVVPEQSKWSKSGPGIEFVLEKKDS